MAQNPQRAILRRSVGPLAPTLTAMSIAPSESASQSVERHLFRLAEMSGHYITVLHIRAR
jgi:hypothetical protein